MADTVRFVEAVLSWSRAAGGTVAVLKRAADDAGWTEIGRTDASEFAATGLHPQRSYTFAVVPVEADGSLAPETEWETLRVVPTAEVMNEAMRLAKIITSKPRATIAIGKEAFYRQIEMSLAEAYDYAAEVMVENMMHAESKEGIGAFIEKRTPDWDKA